MHTVISYIENNKSPHKILFCIDIFGGKENDDKIMNIREYNNIDDFDPEMRLTLIDAFVNFWNHRVLFIIYHLSFIIYHLSIIDYHLSIIDYQLICYFVVILV